MNVRGWLRIGELPTPNLAEVENKAVVFANEEPDGEPSELQLSLVGKLWTNHPFNAQAFMRTMKKLVILIEISRNEQPSNLYLDHASMCVRVYDAPFNIRKPRFIELLGEKVGSFVELDKERSLTQGKFIKFRVSIDVWSPLLRGSLAQGSDGKEYSDDLRASLMCKPLASRNSGHAPPRVKWKLVFKLVIKDSVLPSPIGGQTREDAKIEVLEPIVTTLVLRADNTKN
ncbi:hypothetical protein Tsubulata_029083 [Turnera subulata]|uniref:DUF4283 domain-containing protein n=1 Tax=Turnera subulata TaxID=218843 RepID=A0A9Q0G9G1_9ROSI|nr:hypothetical protein Tsubulata_029083 [Turnera subulata]